MPSPVSIFYSLRTKFMLFACTLVILISLVWGGWTWTHERQMLQAQLEDAGSVLVSSMAIPIINALLYEELGLVSEGGLLDNFILDIMKNPQLDPVYAMVTDVDGKILAHSQINLYGQVMSDPQTAAVVKASAIVLKKLQWHNQDILDIGSPLAIHGKRWGALRVGLSLAPLRRQLQQLSVRIISFSCLFAAAGVLIFYFAGSRLVYPLRRLATIMTRVDGDQLARVPVSERRDEIGLLQNSFSAMLKRLRRSERERDESLKSLLENERLITAGKIASGVAHEINNPLAGINGALEVLERKPETLDQYLPHVQAEVERVSRIVGQLLDLSRAGELETSLTEARRLLDEMVKICQLVLKGKRRVRLSLVEPVPEVVLLCDSRKLQQVVLNLVINAADAMDDDGAISLQAASDDQTFVVRVEDTGPGVPAHLKEQIFTPFFTTKTAGQGTGIGLAFCQGTIEKHGGTLKLVDSPAGACFEIRIPLRTEL